jgi:hypothetical protein
LIKIFIVGSRLGKTLAEMADMPISELNLWIEFFGIENEYKHKI